MKTLRDAKNDLLQWVNEYDRGGFDRTRLNKILDIMDLSASDLAAYQWEDKARVAEAERLATAEIVRYQNATKSVTGAVDQILQKPQLSGEELTFLLRWIESERM
jgi:hypothetical protein